MKFADIKQYDVANGPGVRVSIFVSGCRHNCPGCFNQAALDFNYGKTFTEVEIQQILDYLAPDYVQGLTLLGGEPFEPVNQEGLIHLLRAVKKTYPDKDIWSFTGFIFERDLLNNMCLNLPYTKEMISYLDVLIDGPFVLALRNPSLKFKGSSNQRTIDVKASLAANKTILLFE